MIDDRTNAANERDTIFYLRSSTSALTDIQVSAKIFFPQRANGRFKKKKKKKIISKELSAKQEMASQQENSMHTECKIQEVR